MRTSGRAARRSRSKSKLNELKRQARAPGGSRFRATRSPRRSSSPTSARRNWLPPPVGAGRNSWKTARSDERRQRIVEAVDQPLVGQLRDRDLVGGLRHPPNRRAVGEPVERLVEVREVLAQRHVVLVRPEA